MCRPYLVLAVLLAAVTAAHADPVLPTYFKLPPKVTTNNVRAEDYGEARMVTKKDADAEVKNGRLFAAELVISDLGEDAGSDKVWAALKPSLIGGGWSVAVEQVVASGQGFVTLRHAGKKALASIQIFGPTDIRISIIEESAKPTEYKLKAPAAKPETVPEKADFPFLTPPPGAKRQASDSQDAPFTFTKPGEEEVTQISEHSSTKSYDPPPGMSNLMFALGYKAGLTKAGWQIVVLSQGIDQSDALILAHYAKNKRDIWAELHDGSSGIVITVADVGAEDWAKQLTKECKLQLYGIVFDFDKATIKKESDATLTKVKGLLDADKTLELDIGGHTDNIGKADYNLKLSDDRAKAVVGWLTKNGIDAKRLSSKGFGLTQPIADNGSTEGRARNRRVELTKRGCKK